VKIDSLIRDAVISEILRMYGIIKYFLVAMSTLSIFWAAMFLFESIVSLLLNSFFSLTHRFFEKSVSMDSHCRGVI